MSTHCRIGIRNADKSITSIYCHYDGEPINVGQNLQKNFNTIDLVKQLITLGDLSNLGTIPESNPSMWKWIHSPENYATCLAYKDRGDEADPITCSSEEFNNIAEQYNYLFEENVWKLSQDDNQFQTYAFADNGCWFYQKF